MDPLAPELPPQHELEELLERASAQPDDEVVAAAFAAALLDAHLGLPGHEDEEGRFAPEIRTFGEQAFAIAFTHPVRVERFLEVAERSPGKLVVHAAPGRALLGELVRNNTPLMLNPANGYVREFTVQQMSTFLNQV
ncbi:hypothetical protein [Nocardioides cavernaquae]|uniref:SseB family protein n=1 Tax=Nocardioides cavernaquae TaxID=2321396 RepID=A0A3A5HHG1_9ACTN|nr:hypothetical protein [Nocardioides cavernaquae]RJS47127.1 hypothetical protein D4739_13455 [Nocardioides cavernaquae]